MLIPGSVASRYRNNMFQNNVVTDNVGYLDISTGALYPAICCA